MTLTGRGRLPAPLAAPQPNLRYESSPCRPHLARYRSHESCEAQHICSATFMLREREASCSGLASMRNPHDSVRTADGLLLDSWPSMLAGFSQNGKLLISIRAQSQSWSLLCSLWLSRYQPLAIGDLKVPLQCARFSCTFPTFRPPAEC